MSRFRVLFGFFVAFCAAFASAQPSFEFRVTQDWTSGFQAEITIRNGGTTPIQDWTLEFDYTRAITSVWNGTLVSVVGNRYRIRNAGWNATIAPGAAATIGFVASPGGAPSGPTHYSLTQGSGGGGGGNGEGSGVPGTPSLAVSATAQGVIATWNLWYGNNATRWQLFESGSLLAEGALTPNAPHPQSASFTLPPREYAAHAYHVILTNSFGSTSSGTVAYTFGGASPIVLDGLDGAAQATQVTVGIASTTSLSIRELGTADLALRVTSNNSVIATGLVNGAKLTVRGLKPGRASLRIENTATGSVRYLGVRVRTDKGALPALPGLAFGSVSEDTPGDLALWRDFADPARAKRVDVRYIYLNGGPFTGWRTWNPMDGFRVKSFIRESQKLGIVPYFVWYNIPDGGESYWIDRQHISDVAYMRAYFRDLRFTLELIRNLAADEPVGLVLEPDFLGYMMQMSGLRPGQIPAMTQAAYAEGVLDPATDPIFSDSVTGLVQAINYTIRKYAPNARFGWQFNLWASPGITVGIPAKGLMRLTDTLGIAAGRTAIANETREIANYYMEAGVTTHGAHFVSVDKYGLDAGAEPGAATNPASSTWFWHLDHWNNYLLFAKTLRTMTNLPVVLWQIPVGRINATRTVNPATGFPFPDLPNTTTRFEDSATSFFLGDQFTATGARKAWFSTNQGGDPGLTVNGDVTQWRHHLRETSASGVSMILWGAGVGDSTDGVGSPPTDDGWWIHKVMSAPRW
ncbi:MAG TPA: cellulose binding domain-containing protein [Fimbriimonadaceae bacterium]|nr:cellulose binding domain-containing protein [Fimbriimonadaceae bacterium]